MPRQGYRKKVERENKRLTEISEGSRDVSKDYPRRSGQAMREKCRLNFRLFCETYFPNAFHMKWSPDHLKVIAAIERSVLKSGLLALAMPRGSGKTALCVRAALWALLYGHRRFVCLIAATEELAQKLMEPIKTELMLNERLYRPFRQVTHPIVRLENNGRRCIGQLFKGQQTRITWGADRLVFPTMPDSACDGGVNVSGSCVTVAGLTGAIRGQSSTLADGTIIRPELVLLDDPQTRESALSPTQSEQRESIIKGDVLGMAGPGRKISALMPCTVISQGDMADRMLDRSKNPQWSGQRTKMVYSFPTSKLWEEFARLYLEALYHEQEPTKALKLYADNRAEMDQGGVVAWEARKYPEDISALQHAMTLKILDPRMFACEYQNEPLPEQTAQTDDLTHDQIAGKINRLDRGLAPIRCQRLTSFIDVQGEMLFYVVCAWEDNFTGFVVDYGAFPDQRAPYFTLRDAEYTLSGIFPGRGPEGVIYAGLEALTTKLLGQDWRRDDGASLRIEKCLIDANWGNSTRTVYDFCRQSQYSVVLMPSHGKYIGASSIPMSEYEKRAGEKAGFNWRITKEKDSHARRVIYDTNFWKTFVRSRLATAMGDPGCLSLFGDDPNIHRLFADHLTAEYRVRTQGRGRECDEWKQYPNRENHWLDCLVGTTVAASMQGTALGESQVVVKTQVKKVSFAAMQQRAKENRP